MKALANDTQCQEANKENPDPIMRSEISGLVSLVDLMEKSLTCIESSTLSLEKLRYGFDALCDSFRALENKIEGLADVSRCQPDDEMINYAKVGL